MHECSAEAFRFDTWFENNFLVNFDEIASTGLPLDETLNWQFSALVTINVLARQGKNPTNTKVKVYHVVDISFSLSNLSNHVSV